MALEAVNDVVSFVDAAGRRQQSDGPIPGATSATPQITREASPTPVSPDQQITIATLQAVQSLTVPATATIAKLQNNTTSALRWRDTGSNPTIAIGQRILAGEELVYNGSLAALKIIAEAAGTGTLDIAYYR